MANRKPDRRVIKTKRAIRRAFVELMSAKEMDSITVTDIAATADINRKTFYNYYTGVPQVLEEIEDEVVTAFASDLTELDFLRDNQDIRVVFTRFRSLVEEDPEFYDRLFHTGNTHLIEKMTAMLRQKGVEFCAARGIGDPDVIEVVVDYTVSGIMAVERSWILGGRKMPEEQLCRLVTDLTNKGTQAILSRQKEPC